MSHPGSRLPTGLGHSADTATSSSVADALAGPDGPLPDLEATRAIRQSDLEACLLQDVLLASCRTPDGRPLADDEATRMIHTEVREEDTTSTARLAAAGGDEETTTQDTTATVDDDATLWGPAEPVVADETLDEGDQVDTEPSAPPPVAAPRPATRHRARSPLAVRQPPAATPVVVPIVPPAPSLLESRRLRRRKILVTCLMVGLFIAAFWAAATAPTASRPPPPPSSPAR